MGECHLCENISSIDALILMADETFASRTLEQDKYKDWEGWGGVQWLVPASCEIRLQLDKASALRFYIQMKSY